MITHVIYHIPGRKVGCTKSLRSRSQRYFRIEGSVPEMVILEELHDKTDQEAGDIEWQWADKFGYRRGVHYAHSARISIEALTVEQRRENGRKGGLRTAEVLSPEYKTEIARNRGLRSAEARTLEQKLEFGRTAGFRRAEVLTPERRSEIAQRAALSLSPEQRRERSRKAGLVCGLKTGFSRRALCPHCGTEANIGILHKFHLDRCKHRPMIRRS